MTNVVKIINPKTHEEVEYFIHPRLKKNLDKIRSSLKNKDEDCILCIDGKEGTGKSTLAMQVGKYVDPTLDLNHVVFSPDDFRDAILRAKKGECIIYDEAFTGYSSRSSLSPVNRVLVSLAMQMRQKNLFILIVLPTIFLLDKYMALFRTKSLIHVYKNKGVRGYFRVYNDRKKKLLIIGGNKTMTYKVKGLYTRFKGRFYGKFALGDDSVDKKYRKKKEEALADSEKTSMTSGQVKFKEQRDLLIWLFKNYTGVTYQQMENILSEYEFNMSFQQIGKICNNFGLLSAEKVKDSLNKEEKKEELKIIELKEEEIDDFEDENLNSDGIISDNDDFED